MAVKLIDELQKEIKAAGEAVKQEAYEKAYDHVFQILDNLEKLLNDNRYLEGNEITEEDKRLYDILIRFDAVYYFKQRLNRKALRDYDNLWNYAKELYSIPEYKEFADFEKIKQEELLGTKEENPYQMADHVPGVGFKTADEIASKGGIHTDSEYRIRSGIFYTLMQSGSEGHVYLLQEVLLYRASQLLDVEIEHIEKYVMGLAMEKKVVLNESDEGQREL